LVFADCQLPNVRLRSLSNPTIQAAPLTPVSTPVALTIAGSDNSAGAGAQADLKTMSALGVYGLTAITCVVAEVPGKVSAIQPITPEIVAEQIRLCFEAYPIAALKTGMLHSRAIIERVCDTLGESFAGNARRPLLIVDPVMVASSGDLLLERDAISAYRERLFPLAALITPNLDEVRALLGRTVSTVEQMHDAGRELAQLYGTAFLLKGGHLREPEAIDLLFAEDSVSEFRAPFVPGVSTHGTGCTYAAAITSYLAHGLPLLEAVGKAKQFVTAAVTYFLRWEKDGHRTDALHHFVRL
jgi:hydroxymethylpyrimidine/phosphomethylpyrimidine kinase